MISVGSVLESALFTVSTLGGTFPLSYIVELFLVTNVIKWVIVTKLYGILWNLIY